MGIVTRQGRVQRGSDLEGDSEPAALMGTEPAAPPLRLNRLKHFLRRNALLWNCLGVIRLKSTCVIALYEDFQS
jgi:hypothetical protein